VKRDLYVTNEQSLHLCIDGYKGHSLVFKNINAVVFFKEQHRINAVDKK